MFFPKMVTLFMFLFSVTVTLAGHTARNADRAVYSQTSAGHIPGSRSLRYIKVIPGTMQLDTTPQLIGKMAEVVERYRCQLCSKVNGSRLALERHLLTHTGERNHVCFYCNKAFTICSSLYRHIRAIHDRNFVPK